jgi:hypothetical protein
MIWISGLPKTRKRKARRFMSVVQLLNRPANLGDYLHNPILFQKIVQLPNSQESEYVAKGCLHAAEKALYWLLAGQLKALTRPLLRYRGSLDGTLPDSWLALDPPSESISGDWRNQIMWKLGSEWLGNWDQIDSPERLRTPAGNFF